MSKNLGENISKEESEDWEARNNLSGFFRLLLKVDMRNHPELYEQFLKEKTEEYENIRGSNTTNKTN